MPQSHSSELPSKDDFVRLQLKLSTSLIPGATLQWLKSHGQQDQLLEAGAAFWSPFAVREQNPDPMWSQAQAHLSIARLQQHILLIQRSFGMMPTTNSALNPLISPMSEGVFSQPAPIPVQAAIPVAAPALPAPIPFVVPSAIPVISLVPLSVPQSQPIPLEDDEFDGYGGIHLKGFEDFDAADAANAALDELDD